MFSNVIEFLSVSAGVIIALGSFCLLGGIIISSIDNRSK